VVVHCVTIPAFYPHTISLTHHSEGAVTGVVALFGFWLLPSTPLKTGWLKPHEREMAHARMERDRVGDSGEVSMMAGLKQVRVPTHELHVNHTLTSLTRTGV